MISNVTTGNEANREKGDRVVLEVGGQNMESIHQRNGSCTVKCTTR